MRYIILLPLLISLAFGDILSIDSFQADFTQSITNDKGNRLEYKGHVKAAKPQYALWSYTQPVTKEIFINSQQAIIIEPEIEQVLIKKINSNFDFFALIKNAVEVDKDIYKATFQEVIYSIRIKASKIESISYKNELENRVVIIFSNQIQNKNIDTKVFTPNIPTGYDIIRG